MPTQLSPSPLAIRAHEFREIHLDVADEENPQAPLSLDFNRTWGASQTDPLDWMLELTVAFGPGKKTDQVPYTGRIRAVGYFRIHEAYPEKNRESLICITGASILYGACREMLANLTARSSHGMISLPSISFIERPAKKQAAPTVAKTAARKATAKKKAKKSP